MYNILTLRVESKKRLPDVVILITGNKFRRHDCDEFFLGNTFFTLKERKEKSDEKMVGKTVFLKITPKYDDDVRDGQHLSSCMFYKITNQKVEWLGGDKLSNSRRSSD